MHRAFHLKTSAWFAYLLLLGLSGQAAEVQLKPRATSRGPLVRLGEIAEITDDDPGIVQQLQKLPLFPVPSSGKSRVVARGEVQQILVMHEVNLRVVRLKGADEVAISHTGASQSPASKVAKPATHPASLPAATLVQTAAQTPVPEKHLVETVVALRSMRAGELLTQADFEARLMPAEQRRGKEPVTTDALLGKELKRGIAANQPFDAEMVQTPRLVQRGEKVTVRSIAPGIVISDEARAIEAGGKGDLVTVDFLDARGKMLAYVTARQTVEVYSGGAKYPTRPAGETQP